MVPAPVVVGMRPLTPAEATHLDRLREFLTGSRVDVSDAPALGALLDSQLARWRSSGASELPEAMLAAFGVGIGDLVLAAEPSARWVLRTSTDRPAPALLAAVGGAAVVPLDDVRERWASGARGWVPGYVAAAAGHLAPPVADAPAPLPPRVAQPPADDATAAQPATAPRPTETRGEISAFRSRRADRVPRPRIPADLPVPPSIPVQILALRLLDQVLELASGSADPRALAYVALGSQGSLRVVADQGAGRALVSGSDVDVAAVVWVGALDDDGRVGHGTPAVLVEAGERGTATLVVGHRFAAAPVDDLVIVGQGAPLLHGTGLTPER